LARTRRFSAATEKKFSLLQKWHFSIKQPKWLFWSHGCGECIVLVPFEMTLNCMFVGPAEFISYRFAGQAKIMLGWPEEAFTS